MELLLPVPLHRLVFWVAAFIGCCSLVAFAHPGLRGPAKLPVRQAIHSWWPPALFGFGVVLGGFHVGAIVAVCLFAVVSAWTLREYLRLLPDDEAPGIVNGFCFATVPVAAVALVVVGDVAALAVALVWIFGLLPMVWLRFSGPAGTLGGLPRRQFGLVLTVVALGHVPALVHLDVGGSAGGAGLAGFVMVVVMANDAAQYVSGKALGRRRLAPLLSPKKTWEGLVGGLVVCALVAGMAGPLVTPLSVGASVGVGLMLGVLGLAGDLLISGVKRDAGVKDTGAVLPGQGGLLDRSDSLLLAGPVAYHALSFLLLRR